MGVLHQTDDKQEKKIAIEKIEQYRTDTVEPQRKLFFLFFFRQFFMVISYDYERCGVALVHIILTVITRLILNKKIYTTNSGYMVSIILLQDRNVQIYTD